MSAKLLLEPSTTHAEWLSEANLKLRAYEEARLGYQGYEASDWEDLTEDEQDEVRDLLEVLRSGPTELFRSTHPARTEVLTTLWEIVAEQWYQEFFPLDEAVSEFVANAPLRLEDLRAISHRFTCKDIAIVPSIVSLRLSEQLKAGNDRGARETVRVVREFFPQVRDFRDFPLNGETPLDVLEDFEDHLLEIQDSLDEDPEDAYSEYINVDEDEEDLVRLPHGGRDRERDWDR